MKNVFSILFAGDFVPHDRTRSIIDNGEYERLITGEIREQIDVADYAVVNLEAPVILPGLKPIKKIGPTLSAGNNTPKAIRYAGFEMTVLANNHMNDYGGDGILNTINRCQEEGLDIVGAGKNKEQAAQMVVKDIAGKKVAFINCCEHEFSVTKSEEPGCNPLDPIAQHYAIKDAKTKADYIILVVHGGIEHYQLPTPRMQQTYRFFVDAGADAVVNHHQHCYSGYEMYHGHPIIYGLGNFCFDWQKQKRKTWQEGYMAKLTIGNELLIELIPYIQNGAQVGVRLMNQEEKGYFNQEIEKLNGIISNPKRLTEEYETFLIRTDKLFRAVLSLYPGRILTALCRKGWLPVWNNSYRFRRIWLNISCESHLDRLKHYLQSNIH